MMIVAGFWRRLGAFALDVIILGLAGSLSALVLAGFYTRLGAWGPLVGLVVAAVYFGIFNSRIGHGQTPGKRALGIRVVGADHQPISPLRAVVRLLLFWTPFTVNSMITMGLVMNLQLAALLLLPFMIWAVLLVYLFVFNRRTRQSLHDLLVSTYVIRVTSPLETDPPPVWRVHYIVCGVIALVFICAGVSTTVLAHVPFFEDMLAVRQAIVATGDVRAVTVTGGTTVFVDTGGTSKKSVYGVEARLKYRPASMQAEAARLADIVLKTSSRAASYDEISVTVLYGYNIGIASSTTSFTDSHPPSDWRAKPTPP